jgi:putative transposase
MNAPRGKPEAYMQFPVASPRVFSCTEAAAVQPHEPLAPSHDAFTRMLHRLEPGSDALWEEAKAQVTPDAGVLILDDSTLDKPYSEKIELVTRHWSGKHHRVVQGINLISLVWADGGRIVPCDFRLYHKSEDGLTKNDHFAAMLGAAKGRGLRPEYALFDSWYSSLENLKAVRRHGWHFLTRLKSNRLVNTDRQGLRPVSDVYVPPGGRVVHLKGFGPVKVLRVVATNGDVAYWATDDPTMGEPAREDLGVLSWKVEEYHRGIKQFCGVERCQARGEVAQRNHIGFALRAFVRLESYCFRHAVTWFEAKVSIVREAIRNYLSHPTITLQANA